MKCRIDKRGKQVFTPQNERSKLFDKLHNITGDFQKALDVFGITETSGFKEFKNRLRPISKLNSTDPVLFQGVLERLQMSGLSDNIFKLNTQQLNQKLIELGISAEVRNQIQAWHGSPHLFQKFSTKFMGSGEGAQAFGWGLYFTDLVDIARKYASENVKSNVFINGEQIDISQDLHLERIVKESNNNLNVLKKEMKDYYDEYKDNPYSDADIALTIYEAINNNEDVELDIGAGNLYNVTLHQGKQPSEYTWLEWDKEVSKRQLEDISRNVLDKTLAINTTGIFQFQKNGVFYRGEKTNNKWNFINRNTGEAINYNEVSNAWQELYNQEVLNKKEFKFYKRLEDFLESDKNASLFLLESGIDGIKYPAESVSRGATSDNARGFNYVVFDENAVTIEEVIQFQKEGVTLIPNGFVITEDGKRNIYLNSDNLNLDTLLHENGHLFLDTLKQRFPEHYQAGLELLTKNSVEAQPYIDYVNATQPNLKPHSEAWKEEVLAQIIGNKGEQLIKSRKKNTIKQWLEDLWSFIGEQFGLTSYTPSEIAEMTLEEFAEAVNVEMLSGEELKFESEAQAIKEISKDKLLAVHNLSISNLLNVDKQGGLAVPSLAVINTDNPFTSFGEITLVADKSLIDPKASRLNKAFASDSYSVRYPSITYTPNLKKLREFNKRVKEELPYLDEMDSFRNIDDRGRVDVEKDDVTKLLFLKEQGKEKDFVFRESKISDKYLDRFEKLLEKTRDSFDFTREDGKVYQEFSEIVKEKAVEELKQENLDEFEFNSLLPIVGKVSSNNYSAFRQSLNARKNKELDVYKTLNKNQVDVNSEEYQNFVDEIYDSLEVSEQIFKGYTPSGNRRYVPHTIENVVRMMKGGARNGEGSFYGVGSVRAGIVKQFKSIKDIKDSQDKIVRSEEFEKVKEEISNEFLELGEKLKPFYKYQTDSFGYFDNVGESLIEFYNRGRSQDFNQLDKETEQEVKDFLEKLYNLPTEYFEVKVERAVDLSEFKGALIPKNTPIKVRNVLESKGLKVVEYSGKTDYNEFADLRFQNQTEVQKELEQIKAQAIANGTFMKAPNGKGTNLNERQWLQVRSKAFTDWFGDWLNDPQNASKVVDENGEPMVVYHGTNAKFNEFDTNERLDNSGRKATGAYFSKNLEYASSYSKTGNIISAFINIRNPKYSEEYTDIVAISDKKDMVVNDGIIYNDTSDNPFSSMETFFELYVPNPNQIKSATENTGTFSEQSSDIRYQVTEEVKNSPVKTSISKSENPSFDSMLDFSTIGGVLEIGRIEGRDIYSILYLKVDESYRRQGVASKLLKEALNKTNGNLSGQASNDAAVELNYKLGMRAYKNEKELSLEESKTERAKSGGESIRMILPESMRGENYKPFVTNTSETESNPDIRFQIDYQNFQNNNLRSHMFVENNSKLGSIRTKPTQRGEKVDSAIVYEAYRGQGVGTELYLETVRNLMVEGKILESDNSQTAPAKRIWEKLVEWGLAIKTGESNFESVPAPSWMTAETTIDEVISNQPIDRSEPSLQELMTYINFQGEANVTKTEVIELMQANEILDSHELLERLSRAEEQGIFIFTLERLKQTGLFENYEAHKILESKERQSKIKDTLKWLRQNDNFEIQPTQLEKGGSLLSTGKIERQAEESEVTVQDLEGNQVKSNVRLSETITFDYNETLSNNIAFLNQIVRETTWDNLSSQVKDILNSIEVSALDNGIDLRGLAEKYHSATREDILGFLNSLESTLEGNIRPQEFEANRNEFLNFNSITENKEVSRTEVVLGDRLEADVALRDYNLLKVAPDVYKRVPNITYTELLQAEANRRGVEAEVLNREVNENFDRSLEDVEQAKLIYLLNSNLNTQETKIQPNLSKLDTFQGNFDYIVEQFPKDFGKWVIETNNNYFKLDWRGITLTNPNQSELAFESVPDYFKEDLLEYSKLSKYLNFNREFDLVYDLDSLQVERDRVINNAQALEEYKGDYVTLKNGEGIMIRNGQGQFIKLNGLVFEQVDEHNNLVFYKPLPKLNEDSLMEIEIPKPVLESNVFDYTLYQTQAKEIENLNRETNRTDYEC